MTLQQLRFLAAVLENDFNITAAAHKLRATQPAVSRQLLLLEQELGFSIFTRNGRMLSRLTPPGEKVIEHARRALRETQNIKRVSADFTDPRRGELRVGTTHTQARYVLPQIARQFRALYPGVDFHLHQGSAEQIAEMASGNRIDFAIATGAHDLFSQFVLLPCYRWHWRVVVPAMHPLAVVRRPSLEQLAAYPIVTYVLGVSGPSSLQETFVGAGVAANVSLTARDAEVIKTYVRVGLGVGIIPDVTVDAELDRDLVSIDVAHLFPAHTTWAGFPKEGVLRHYMYEFLALLAPHLTRQLVERAHASGAQAEIDALFPALPLSAQIAS